MVLDLEWNGAFCKQLNGYFNEIIEIGAVKLHTDFSIAERFDVLIRPRVSRKLTHWVTDLTGFTDEQVRQGTTFAEAMERLSRFVGDEETVLLTWSTTDLLVFMENCRYYYGEQSIPFGSHYLDLQAYAQQRLGLGTAQQVALAKFAELLGMDSSTLELHHAIDDSILSARVLARVYEAASFNAATRPMNEEFYRRITFKPSFVRELDDPSAKAADFTFRCEACGKRLRLGAPWQFVHRYFQAPLQCPACAAQYVGRVQIRRLFDSTQVKRRLLPTKQEKSDEVAAKN